MGDHVESKAGRVPFSWENKPGISKSAAVNRQDQQESSSRGSKEPGRHGHDLLIKKKLLPPPPLYRSTDKTRVYMKKDHHKDDDNHDQVLLSVPLPPCAFHQVPTSSKRTSSRKTRLINKIGGDYYGTDDPFLNAYKECTKSSTKSADKSLIKGIKKGGFFGISTSCKSSCSVRDDNLVKVSQLPRSFSSQSEKEERFKFN